MEHPRRSGRLSYLTYLLIYILLIIVRWNILGDLDALPDVGTGPAWVRYPPSLNASLAAIDYVMDQAYARGMTVCISANISAYISANISAYISQARATAELLTLLDGAAPRCAEIVVIGATNSPDAIDEALRARARRDIRRDAPRCAEIVVVAIGLNF